MRKCYEVEASVQDYLGRKTGPAIAVAKSGEAVYKTCCHMMLVRYIETHKGINPWTGSKEDFYSLLPSTVYYEADDHHVKNFAFVEENEIAYVCGSYDSSFTDFAQNLVMVLFGSYEHIYFEADDCDSFAIALKNLFTNQAEFSFDTYVLY